MMSMFFNTVVYFFKVRGNVLLKKLPGCLFDRGVALFTGAWIETFRVRLISSRPEVALFTGAWIETLRLDALTDSVACRSLHGSVD